MIGEFCFAVPHDTPAVNTGDEMGLHQFDTVGEPQKPEQYKLMLT
jgi:hypothetical protein